VAEIFGNAVAVAGAGMVDCLGHHRLSRPRGT
jgi:hypothetical protein